AMTKIIGITAVPELPEMTDDPQWIKAFAHAANGINSDIEIFAASRLLILNEPGRNTFYVIFQVLHSLFYGGCIRLRNYQDTVMVLVCIGPRRIIICGEINRSPVRLINSR